MELGTKEEPVGEGGRFFEQGIQPEIFLGTYEPQARDVDLGGLD
jgi:hypothetical protein